MEAVMPVLETVGPMMGRPSAPLPAKRTALDKFGALPAPSLQWNAEVERDTAHLYARIKNVVPSIECRSLRLMSAPSTQ